MASVNKLIPHRGYAAAQVGDWLMVPVPVRMESMNDVFTQEVIPMRVREVEFTSCSCCGDRGQIRRFDDTAVVIRCLKGCTANNCRKCDKCHHHCVCP